MVAMDVPTLIRRCRQQAGLSQRELAVRAATSQPALARYERGRTTPSIATLQRIVEATGHQLQLAASPTPSPVATALAQRRERVRAILTRHGVQRAQVFGSVARHQDTEASDLDLLVDLPNATYVTLASLRADLEEELGHPVDVTTRALLVPEAYEAATREAVVLL